ncbi:MAG: hypothetical protein PHT57_10615 [Rhodoferax sp.]|nr:hypothetical protein [Rhodoferax sp.]
MFSHQHEVIDMRSQTEHSAQIESSVLRADERVLLLEEINFKWLLAGMGLWIDMARFRTDPSYAARFLALAEASNSPALQQCAASLQGKKEATCQ